MLYVEADAVATHVYKYITCNALSVFIMRMDLIHTEWPRTTTANPISELTTCRQAYAILVPSTHTLQSEAAKHRSVISRVPCEENVVWALGCAMAVTKPCPLAPTMGVLCRWVGHQPHLAGKASLKPARYHREIKRLDHWSSQ